MIHKIEIPEFITHAPKSKNKKVKINGQSIYNGGMNHHTRSKIVSHIHKYIKSFLPKNLKINYPIEIELEFHAPINYGDVRRIKGKNGYRISWKKPHEGYKPSWDCDNQWIWCKCFNDTLVENGYLPDDNVSIIKKSGGVKWIPVDELEDRKLIFIIKEI
jgi:hypothetical protein